MLFIDTGVSYCNAFQHLAACMDAESIDYDHIRDDRVLTFLICSADMDALYENRQTLKVQFTQQQQEYAEQKKADKAEQQKRLEESKRTSTCAAVR